MRMMWRTAVAAGLVTVMILSVAPSWAHGEHDGDGDGEGHVSYNEWTGFISCGVSSPVVTGNLCGSVDSNDDFLHTFTADDDLQTVVVALEWDSQPVAGAERLRLLFEEDGTTAGGPSIASGEGASPVEFRVDAGEDFDPVEGEWDLQFRVFLPFEPMVAYQQPFTVHYHLFHGEPAPADYSALPHH